MEKFHHDLTRIYQLSSDLQARDGIVFETLTAGKEGVALTQVDALLSGCGLALESGHRLAAARRLYMLREDGLLQAFKAAWPEGEPRQKAARQKAREAARVLHAARLETLLRQIENEALLTPFYRAVLKGMHRAGLAFNRWHPIWLEAVEQSHRVIESSAGGAENAAAWLAKNHLYDPDEKGEAADRCYSVLNAEGKILTYAQVFATEIADLTRELEAMRGDLSTLEDPDLNEKSAWLDWIDALIAALGETDRGQTLLRWRAVDTAWMAINGPVQPGHPLEYYEDRHRRAVAPEWDVRLSAGLETGEARKNKVRDMARKLYAGLNLPEGQKAVLHAENSLEKTRLFMGRPLLFYGALLDGLFSAQVVPNDEQVSSVHGKKIFAFADAVLQTAQMRPFMRLEEEVFEPEFLARYRLLVKKESARWHQVYEIETVGHELGHVLWMDDSTETTMNVDGSFKLIEEFKATAGGLMAFFDEKGDQETLVDLAVCHIKRAVELTHWRESGEVAAYYHEALIHLSGLFESGVVRFEGQKLRADLSASALGRLETWYRATYADLARHYLKKRPAGAFLTRFVQGDLPVLTDVKNFVLHYWERYRAIGQEVSRKGAHVA